MQNKGSINIGFLGTLTIVFIVLKLIGEISWSWVWVLSPLWLPLAFVLCSLFLALVIGMCIILIELFFDKDAK